MPFCSHCGTSVQPTDVYCWKCGFRQPVAAPPPPPRGAAAAPPPPRAVNDLAAGVTPRTASILCYIPWVGWIAAIVVLASNKFRENRVVRFHAFQGLYLFVAWLIVQWVVEPFFRFPGVAFHFSVGFALQFGLLAVSVFMMVKANEEQPYSLPILGELAERSLAEH